MEGAWILQAEEGGDAGRLRSCHIYAGVRALSCTFGRGIRVCCTPHTAIEVTCSYASFRAVPWLNFLVLNIVMQKQIRAEGAGSELYSDYLARGRPTGDAT